MKNFTGLEHTKTFEVPVSMLIQVAWKQSLLQCVRDNWHKVMRPSNVHMLTQHYWDSYMGSHEDCLIETF